jgi:hypothetical protein
LRLLNLFPISSWRNFQVQELFNFLLIINVLKE